MMTAESEMEQVPVTASDHQLNSTCYSHSYYSRLAFIMTGTLMEGESKGMPEAVKGVKLVGVVGMQAEL